MPFNKVTIIDQIINQLESELATAINSANAARSAATDEQSIAETQYDTLGLEASYLAHGQSERAAELISHIALYKNLRANCHKALSEVSVGALVELTSANDNQHHYYFIGPSSGGIKAIIDNITIAVISANAPLAQELLHREVDDSIIWPSTSNCNWWISHIS